MRAYKSMNNTKGSSAISEYSEHWTVILICCKKKKAAGAAFLRGVIFVVIVRVVLLQFERWFYCLLFLQVAVKRQP